MRKRIILPSFVDKDKEFGEIAIYYENTKALLEIFKNAEELSKKPTDQKFFEKFTTDNVFRNLMRDLRLCSRPGLPASAAGCFSSEGETDVGAVGG